MIRKRLLLLPALAFLQVVCSPLLAQDDAHRTEPQNCTQILRTARSLYADGRLHELSFHMEGCLTTPEDQGGFTKPERIEAYKILTLTHIYLEEPGKADTSMIALLHTNPFVKLDTAIDPIELHNLYRKFKTDPSFMIGLKIGANLNHINVLANHYYWAHGQGLGEYKSFPRFQYTLFFEKIISRDKRLIASPEFMYTTHSFEYTNNSPLDEDERDGSALSHTLSYQRIQLNLIAQYRLKPQTHVSDRFIPFVAGGPAVGYLLNSTFTGTINVGETRSEPAFDTKFHYRPVSVSLIAIAGFKYNVGAFYFTADVRFQYGFLNVVNKNNRFRWTPDSEDMLDLGYTDNDFSMSHSMLNVGIVIPRFHPVKTTR